MTYILYLTMLNRSHTHTLLCHKLNISVQTYFVCFICRTIKTRYNGTNMKEFQICPGYNHSSRHGYKIDFLIVIVTVGFAAHSIT